MSDPTKGERRPSVALVAHTVHEYGGNDRSLAELIMREHDRIDFVVLSAILAPRLRQHVVWKRVPVPLRPFPLRFIAFFIVAGLRVLRSSADLIHTQGAIIPNAASVISVHFCHAGYLEATGRLAPGGSSFLRRLNHGATRVLAVAAEKWCYRSSRARVLAAVSNGIDRELRRHYPQSPRVVVTPNGVDTDRFHPNGDTRRVVRRNYGVGSDTLVVLFLGGDWDRKGLAIAIEALAFAQRACDVDLVLWIVGEGNRHRFMALAQHHAVGRSVRFFGPQEETEPFYQAADIFCFPTEYEAFPLTALEAASAGLPVVATRVHGVADFLSDGESALLVERESKAVSDAFIRLASDEGLRLKLGEAARERASSYTWGRCVAGVMSVYGECGLHRASESVVAVTEGEA